MAAQYSANDYLSALKALLPPGRVWRASPGSPQEMVLTAIAAGLARLDAAAQNLLVDAFPATSDQLLPEWEATTGLPDPCAGSSPTLQQRQGQVAARVASTGGQSAEFFVDYAARLGFPITIENCATFRAGESGAGDAVAGDDWAHTWIVKAPLTNLVEFRADVSAAGEPLASFGNAVLECELLALKPAHTVLLFEYD